MKQMLLATATFVALVALSPIVSAHPGGGFGHGGMNRGFGHAGFGGHGHAGWGHMGGLRHSSFRYGGGNHHLRASHTSHHSHRGLTPAGFSHGKASWKQNGGTPPGWSKGNKKGWGCTPGSSGCKPPGLNKS